jgi:predicted PurR-regulated permease PerM
MDLQPDSATHAVRQRIEPPGTGSPVRHTRRAYFAAAVLLVALWTARSYLVAVIWAIVIAVAIWPLYRRVKRTETSPRWVAPLLATILSAVVLIVPLVLAVAEIGREWQAVVEWIGRAQQGGIEVPDWLTRLPLLGEYMDGWWRAHLKDANSLGELFGGFNFEAAAAWTRTFGGELAHRLLLAFLTFLTLFLVLRDGEKIGTRLLDLAEDWLGHPGERLFEKMVVAVRSVVNGTVLVAIGEGILIGAGYWIAGLPQAVLFTLLTIMFAMLPLGAWIAFSAAALMLLLQQGTSLGAAGVFGWGAVIMLVGDNFVQPALIGGAARLPLVWTLIGILGGLESFGLVGLFIGPVVMAALYSICRDWTKFARPAAEAQ